MDRGKKTTHTLIKKNLPSSLYPRLKFEQQRTKNDNVGIFFPRRCCRRRRRRRRRRFRRLPLLLMLLFLVVVVCCCVLYIVRDLVAYVPKQKCRRCSQQWNINIDTSYPLYTLYSLCVLCILGKAQADIRTFALKQYSGMEKANKIIGGRRTNEPNKLKKGEKNGKTFLFVMLKKSHTHSYNIHSVASVLVVLRA